MNQISDMSEAIKSVTKRLDKDVREAAKTLTPMEARFLVDLYYQWQEQRIRFDHQIRAMSTAEPPEPVAVLGWMGSQASTLENQVKVMLDIYSSNHPIGEWARTIDGIGPVTAAGLLAHIDIHKAPTAGHIWSFAGLVAGQKWNKGEKRPWNADLKTLCWKIGESFKNVSGKPDAYYGQVYKKRKEFEIENNNAGHYADQAKVSLESKKWDKSTEAYKAYIAGRLPPARILLRAERYAVKLFIAHLHQVWFEHEFKKSPPNPYVIQFLGHVDFLPPPNYVSPIKPTIRNEPQQ